ISVYLPGRRSALAMSELDDRVDERDLDQHENDRTPEEEPIPEEVDVGIELGVVIERRVRILLRTRGERQHEPGRQCGRDELPRAVVRRHSGSVVTALAQRCAVSLALR